MRQTSIFLSTPSPKPTVTSKNRRKVGLLSQLRAQFCSSQQLLDNVWHFSFFLIGPETKQTWQSTPKTQSFNTSQNSHLWRCFWESWDSFGRVWGLRQTDCLTNLLQRLLSCPNFSLGPTENGRVLCDYWRLDARVQKSQQNVFKMITVMNICFFSISHQGGVLSTSSANTAQTQSHKFEWFFPKGTAENLPTQRFGSKVELKKIPRRHEKSNG